MTFREEQNPVILAADPQVTDDLVIQKVLKGEKHLFEILIRRYNARLYRIARSIIKDDVEIDDVMQNAYIKAYQKLHPNVKIEVIGQSINADTRRWIANHRIPRLFKI